MSRYITDSTFRVLRNQGILGHKELYIKNQHCIWSLSCTDENLRGRCSLDGGQTWTEWIELLVNYNGFFAFTVSEVEKLHFTCKNYMGNLIYFCWHGEKVITNILDGKRVEGEKITYQSVMVDGSGNVHVIFFTFSPGKEVWRAYHCYNVDDQWCQPEMIDYGIGKGQSHVAVALDYKGTIHLVYQYSVRSRNQLVYRARNSTTGLWTGPTYITDSGRSNLYPCLVIGESGILHLAWARSDGMNYRVMYRRKTTGGWMVGGWQNKQFLSSQGVNAYTPAVGVWGDKVIVFWQQVDGIYQCSSLDGGNTFNEPVLKEYCNDLSDTNLLALDFYNKQGLNAMTTLDTGNSTVALLANIFQNNVETGENNMILFERQDLPDLTLPSLDYGKSGPNEHMCRIDKNIRRMFFEIEDSRLNNAQVKETIQEQDERIQDLAADLMNIVEEIKSIDKVVKSFVDKVNQVNFKISELEKNEHLLDNKLRSLKEENDMLRKEFGQKGIALNQVKERELYVKQELNQQATTIMELKQGMKLFKQELEVVKNTPFWKKIF